MEPRVSEASHGHFSKSKKETSKSLKIQNWARIGMHSHIIIIILIIILIIISCKDQLAEAQKETVEKGKKINSKMQRTRKKNAKNAKKRTTNQENNIFSDTNAIYLTATNIQYNVCMDG